MPEPMQRVLEQIRGLWTSWSWAQRVVILGSSGAVLAGLLVTVSLGHRPDMVTLFANLAPADAGLIVDQLKSARVTYRVEDNGSRILVPAADVHESRIKLAAAGLPQGGGVGFELFDRSSFGATDFVQKLNFQRALQGELARTIGQIREVQQARVHLVLPQPSVYTEREQRASASVILTLRPGARLGPEQVRAVVHLVSASVEGLDAEHVTVIDGAGRLLSQRAERGGAAPGGPYDHQMAVEAELQQRVQSMLDEVLGPGKSTVRVAAETERSHGERTEERVDPASVVKSEQRTSETSKGATTRPGGIPGTASNLQGATGLPGGASSSETVKEHESVQYEVGRVVERRTLPAGATKRLTVAVLVDPPSRPVRGGDGAERRQPVPRGRAELEQLRTMVMKAVGFNAARGDEVEVAELAFDTSAADRERVQAERAEATAFWWSLVRPAATALGVLIVLLAALAALRRRAGAPRPPAAGPPAGPGLAGQLQARAAAALGPAQLVKLQERAELQDRVGELARSEPEQMAQLLRSWMVRSR